MWVRAELSRMVLLIEGWDVNSLSAIHRRMKMLLALVEVHTLVENRSPSCGLALSAQRCLPMGPTIKHHDRTLSIELWSKNNFKKFGRHFEDKTSKQHYLIGLLNLSHWSDPICTFIYWLFFDLLLADMLWSYVFNSPRTWLFWLPLAMRQKSYVMQIIWTEQEVTSHIES